MAFTRKVNRGFAIRNLDGSDRVASAIRWMIGLATAHRQECLCHQNILASRARLEALLRHLCGAEQTLCPVRLVQVAADSDVFVIT